MIARGWGRGEWGARAVSCHRGVFPPAPARVWGQRIVIRFCAPPPPIPAPPQVRICQRSFKILTEVVGMDATNIIFDPNILTIATGMKVPRRHFANAYVYWCGIRECVFVYAIAYLYLCAIRECVRHVFASSCVFELEGKSARIAMPFANA